VTLFTQGGCHVFALALLERFSYPVHYIPGHGGKGVSHIYCQVAGTPNYAVDVLGFTPEEERVWKDFGSACRDTPAISREKLLSLFKQLADDDGMCGADWFVRPARQRAELRIDRFWDVFSGNRKERIG
jgi:hypothetical protein